MTTGYLLLWAMFLVYVGFRATRLFRKKRFGLAIAMSFLALFVTYEVAMQWYDTRAQKGGSPPASQGPSTPMLLAPPPQAPPSQDPPSQDPSSP